MNERGIASSDDNLEVGMLMSESSHEVTCLTHDASQNAAANGGIGVIAHHGNIAGGFNQRQATRVLVQGAETQHHSRRDISSDKGSIGKDQVVSNGSAGVNDQHVAVQTVSLDTPPCSHRRSDAVTT